MKKFILLCVALFQLVISFSRTNNPPIDDQATLLALDQAFLSLIKDAAFLGNNVTTATSKAIFGKVIRKQNVSDAECQSIEFQSKADAMMFVERTKELIKELKAKHPAIVNSSNAKSITEKAFMIIAKEKGKKDLDECDYSYYGNLGLCTTMWLLWIEDPEIDEWTRLMLYASCMDLATILYYACEGW